MLAAALLAAGLSATAAQAASAILYVDNQSLSCSDAGAGTLAQPFCSIIKAGAVAAAGQTVLVASGSYAGPVAVKKTGTATAPIVVQPAQGAIVAVTGGSHGFSLSTKSYVTIRGFGISGTSGAGISVAGSNHVTIDGNTVSGAGRPVSGLNASGIKLSGTTASLLVGNVTRDNSDHGILLTAGSNGNEIRGNSSSDNARGYTRAAEGIFVATSTGNVIDGNVSTGNEDSGIGLWNGANNSVLFDNVSYGNGDHGIDNLRSSGETITSNTVYRNYDSGIELQGGSSAHLANNITVDNGMRSTRTAGNIRVVAAADAANSTFDFDVVNLSAGNDLIDWLGHKYATLASFQAATGQEPSGLQADPRFELPLAGDLRLTIGSPAIDAANSAAAGQPSTDAAGASRVDDPATPDTGAGPRTFDDRGAFEYQPVVAPDGPPVAVLTVAPASGAAPLTVSADASASSDTDATPIATYAFDFGDGTTTGAQSDPIATHTYVTPGDYTVTVVVTDSGGLSSTATAAVSVTSP